MKITGGRLKGRMIHCDKGNRIRPVLGRLRESLFSLLGNLEGLTVLDLFSGIGSLGIESLSRGASFATFVDRDRTAIRNLEKSISNLDLYDVTKVYRMDVYDYFNSLNKGSTTYNIVYADPPYDLGELARLMEFFYGNPWIAPMIVLKHSVREGSEDLWRGKRPLRVLKRGDDRITILGGGDN